MCGLSGKYGDVDFSVEKSLRAISHRGPDGSGIKALSGCVHGHVRLALVDLSDASAQPFEASGGGLLSFNGEIWNFAEVRSDLEAEGKTFATSGDTEVLAIALSHWGVTEALKRIEGMFCFVWSHDDEHVIVRDRFGEIPLYVAKVPGGFLWSSERKGIPAGVPCRPMPAGSIFDLKAGRFSVWYEVHGDRTRNTGLAQELADGVSSRSVLDAPMCLLVSGGLDSSLIASLYQRGGASETVAYTAVLDESSADLKAARRFCDEFEIDLIEVPVSSPSASSLERAAMAIEICSKAQVEIAAMCLPLAEAIASDGFKACLSGEGADEIFGGYGSMCIKGAKASDGEWFEIRRKAIEKMARGNFVRCNKVFMASGVECRLPFLHRPLVEAAMGMSKVDAPPSKGALKSAAKSLVPDWVITRPKDTFQGGSGMIDAASQVVPDPAVFYRSIVRTTYGPWAVRRGFDG